jgi:hypothetical protein
MKKLILFLFILCAFFEIHAQQMKVITVVESIVPMGIGRSRIIEHQEVADATQYTTDRTDGKKSKQGDVKRKDAKIDILSETKLLNFYSAVGINFRNIASNDALISSKINQMIQDGWSLTFVTSGVESAAGIDDDHGIFITRLFFSKD